MKRQIRKVLILNRITIPEEMLKALGVKQGDYVHVDLGIDDIRIKPVRRKEEQKDVV